MGDISDGVRSVCVRLQAISNQQPSTNSVQLWLNRLWESTVGWLVAWLVGWLADGMTGELTNDLA